MYAQDFCANILVMHTEYVIPALLCVAALILVADFWPVDVDWTSDQATGCEEERAISADKRKATHTKSGAATTSAM